MKSGPKHRAVSAEIDAQVQALLRPPSQVDQRCSLVRGQCRRCFATMIMVELGTVTCLLCGAEGAEIRLKGGLP